MTLKLVFSAIVLLLVPAFALTNCFNDADCLGGQQYCSTDAKLCVDRNWVTIEPSRQRIKLTEQANFMVTVRDPTGKASTYDLELSGDGRYFAKFFGSQTTIRIALQPGEVKRIPLSFSPPSVKSYTVQVQGIDTAYKDTTSGIYSEIDASYVDVSPETTSLTSLSAPGPSAVAYLALAFLGSSFYLGGKKDGKK